MDRPSGPVSRLLPEVGTNKYTNQHDSEKQGCSKTWDGHILTKSFVLHFAVVQVSPLLLLQQVLQALELVNVERLQSNELLSSDECHFLCRVHSCMSVNDTHSPQLQDAEGRQHVNT